MFGAFFDVIHQVGGVCRVLFGRGTTLARAGDRPDGDDIVAKPHQDFRARSDNSKIVEIEEKQEGRGVQTAQAAIEIDRGKMERDRKPLREHDLEDIAGADMALGGVDHAKKVILAHIRLWFGKVGGAFPGFGRRHRRVEGVEGAADSVLGVLPRRGGIIPFRRPDLQDKGDGIL